MLKAFARFLFVSALLSACAHRGAVRVDCEGPMRPINPPAQPSEAPVSVAPAHPSGEKTGETQP